MSCHVFNPIRVAYVLPLLKQIFHLASVGILPVVSSYSNWPFWTENANEYYSFYTIVQGYINQFWMVSNCTFLKSSQCLGVNKLHHSNQFHAFFEELLKRWLGRQNGFIHVPMVSWSVGFIQQLPVIVSFGLWCLKCFSKYFMLVTSYIQESKSSRVRPNFTSAEDCFKTIGS